MPHMAQPSVLDSIELDELGKFVALYADRQARGDESLMPMFSARIDAAWHMLSTDQRVWEAFCDQHAGIPIGHAPVKGSGQVNWVGEYVSRFGPLSEVWFADVSGRVDRAALAEYERSGIVVTD